MKLVFALFIILIFISLSFRKKMLSSFINLIVINAFKLFFAVLSNIIRFSFSIIYLLKINDDFDGSFDSFVFITKIILFLDRQVYFFVLYVKLIVFYFKNLVAQYISFLYEIHLHLMMINYDLAIKFFIFKDFDSFYLFHFVYIHYCSAFYHS